MSNANNNTAPSNLDIAPAQMVGGMRVKQPDAHRTPLKAENKDSKDNENEQTNEEEEEEEERLRQRALQERQAQDMQAHTASRQPDITKNAGSNVKQQFIPSTQPRSMNH
ncbi:hypothetical protein BDF21DRAFT_376727 [Thamnidium elegans]|uniref:Uncharacterized protein n=1 Tax=Thamnidium elegans TaxID=101142 RepID=A0A8H7W2I5_9FUNG|nr:hypothetical protein INT48_003773 [Thamnidium elegans]KAI8091826.1 hypothetical protein BDF21DRAFT_376727 [Thamnidium elegans]